MTTIDHQEALDIATWNDRMGRLIAGLTEGDGDTSHHIRKAYHLHALAPDALRPMMAAPIEEARLEAMLECGAFESAVAGMVGKTDHAPVGKGENHPAVAGRMENEQAIDGHAKTEVWCLATLEAWAVRFQPLRPQPHLTTGLSRPARHRCRYG